MGLPGEAAAARLDLRDAQAAEDLQRLRQGLILEHVGYNTDFHQKPSLIHGDPPAGMGGFIQRVAQLHHMQAVLKGGKGVRRLPADGAVDRRKVLLEGIREALGMAGGIADDGGGIAIHQAGVLGQQAVGRVPMANEQVIDHFVVPFQGLPRSRHLEHRLVFLSRKNS